MKFLFVWNFKINSSITSNISTLTRKLITECKSSSVSIESIRRYSLSSKILPSTFTFNSKDSIPVAWPRIASFDRQFGGRVHTMDRRIFVPTKRTLGTLVSGRLARNNLVENRYQRRGWWSLTEESVHVPRILEAGRIRSVSLITRAPLNPMPRTRANESAVLLEHDRSFASSRFQRVVGRINGDLVRILIYDDKAWCKKNVSSLWANECRAEIRRGNMKEMNEKYLLALENIGVNNRIRNFIFLSDCDARRPFIKRRDFQKLNTKGSRLASVSRLHLEIVHDSRLFFILFCCEYILLIIIDNISQYNTH